MENYDEDLADNSFFQVLQSQHGDLCQKAADNNWLVCVPRAGSLPKYAFTEQDLETHILYNVHNDIESQNDQYRTLNNKDIIINGNVITTGASFTQPSTIHILFEETYYLSNSSHFRALCLESPLDGSAASSHSNERLIHLCSLKDCVDLLWTETGGQRITNQIDLLIHSFNSRFASLEGESLQKHKDAVHSLFASSMQILLKDPRVRKKQHLMDNLKLAVETFVLHGIYDVLMKGITSCLGYQDSKLNKNMRNLSDLQLKDLKVRPEFFQSIPHARRELSRLQSYTTPIGKIGCLKRAVAAITCDPVAELKAGKRIMVSTDDLLPIFIFLVIKSSIPNWLAQITYMKCFKFSTSSTYDYDEYGFYQASLEAAIEHVKSGALFGTSSPEIMMGYSSAFIFEKPLSAAVADENNIIVKFFEAVRTGDDKNVRKYLEQEPEESNEIFYSLCHPLCSCDKCEQFQRRGSWESKPSVYTRDERGYTGLHLASIYGHTSVLEVLLENKVNVNDTEYRGFTSLHLASLRGHHNAVLLLLHFHADWTLVDTDGNTPLHLASANGHKDVVNALLYFTSQKVHPITLCVNAGNDSGDTPLHFASRWGYANIINILIDHGAVVEIANRRKMTPVDCAHNQNIKKILMIAIEREHERKHNGFISVEPCVETTSLSNQSFQDPEFAIEAPEYISPGPLETLERISEKTDKLLLAVSNGDVNLARFYLGFDQPNESDSDEESEGDDSDLSEKEADSTLCHPLCQCKKCIPLAKQYSVKSPPDVHVNSANCDGFTPLHIAVMQGWTEMSLMFLENGANVNSVTKSQRMAAVHYACQKNHVEILKMLLNNDAKVNIKDIYENTPLHYCCIKSHVQCAKVLLENNAAVNMPNYRGNTPLHEASRRNCENLVHLLLKHNAQRSLPNCHNLLPFHIAQNKEMRQILSPQDHGKDSSPVISSRHPMVEYFNPHNSVIRQLSSAAVFSTVFTLIIFKLHQSDSNVFHLTRFRRGKISNTSDEICMKELDSNQLKN